jgi:hypothetical protein
MRLLTRNHKTQLHFSSKYFHCSTEFTGHKHVMVWLPRQHQCQGESCSHESTTVALTKLIIKRQQYSQHSRNVMLWVRFLTCFRMLLQVCDSLWSYRIHVSTFNHGQLRTSQTDKKATSWQENVRPHIKVQITQCTRTVHFNLRAKLMLWKIFNSEHFGTHLKPRLVETREEVCIPVVLLNF